VHNSSRSNSRQCEQCALAAAATASLLSQMQVASEQLKTT
jgi:hypothetical protein